MQFVETALPGVLVIEPDTYRDGRGYFLETYRQDKYRQAGVDAPFVQDNESLSAHATLRGLHAQCRQPQGKLVRVLHGEIHDVAVDIRRGSPTFLRWVGVRLSADNFRQCYVPPGFAHGFRVLSAEAAVAYKCTHYYDPGDELRIAWNDPDIGVEWPAGKPVLSDKDRAARPIRELWNRLPSYDGASGSTPAAGGPQRGGKS